MTDGPAAPPITLRELAAIDVGRLKGVGDRKRASLASVGIDTVLDLLTTYPRRWVDRTSEARVADLAPGQEALVLVEVRSASKRVGRNRRTIVEAVVGDGTGRLHVVFFNQPWRERQLQPGLNVALFGKVDVYRGGVQMTNPIVDLIGDRTGRIVPIYPQSEKAQLSTWEIAGWVENALERCAPRGLADPVPAAVLRELGMTDRQSALWKIHGPDSIAEKEQARRRLAFDELLRVQLALVMRKRAMERASVGVRHDLDGPLVDRFHDALAFPLTGAQRRVIGEIAADLAAPHPMHRLLQGDVGAGKTVVAVTALLAAVQGGYQGALMAPTEVLAEQHFAGVSRLLAGLEVPAGETSLFADRPLRIELLTNRVTGKERKRVLGGLADGGIDLVIGTHALIQEGVDFHRLGVVVVDEQHRFGVEQRAALRDKAGATVPDVLVMTATPIPRTAAMTVYGDLDVSVLDELPPGRTPIVTRWADGPLLEAEAWAAVRAEVAAGRQAYVVCPLIEESEKLEAASAEETFARLQADELAGLRLGLLHGRMAAADKEATMDAFRTRRPRRARRHDRDRGRRRRRQRDGDGDPRRRPLRHRPAAPAAGPRRARRPRVAMLAGDDAGRRARRRQPPARSARRVDRRLRTGRDRPRPARRGHADEHGPEGSQRPPPGLAAPGPRARAPGPGGGVRDRRRRPRARRPPRPPRRAPPPPHRGGHRVPDALLMTFLMRPPKALERPACRIG